MKKLRTVNDITKEQNSEYINSGDLRREAQKWIEVLQKSNEAWMKELGHEHDMNVPNDTGFETDYDEDSIIKWIKHFFSVQ